MPRNSQAAKAKRRIDRDPVGVDALRASSAPIPKASGIMHSV